jgi:hypothetical protein
MSARPAKLGTVGEGREEPSFTLWPEKAIVRWVVEYLGVAMKSRGFLLAFLFAALPLAAAQAGPRDDVKSASARCDSIRIPSKVWFRRPTSRRRRRERASSAGYGRSDVSRV